MAAFSAEAGAQITVSSGFDSSSGWFQILINTPSAQANILPTGGNPGGYADLRGVLENSTLGGAGYYTTAFYTLGSSATQFTLSADAKWFSGPAMDLIPILIQNNRMYSPSSFIPIGTDSNWNSFGPTTFNLSTFSNSSGIPLSPVILTQVGFLARISSPTPVFATGRVGIDNVNLQIIPAPAAGMALLFGFAVRRQRRK